MNKIKQHWASALFAVSIPVLWVLVDKLLGNNNISVNQWPLLLAMIILSVMMFHIEVQKASQDRNLAVLSETMQAMPTVKAFDDFTGDVSKLHKEIRELRELQKTGVDISKELEEANKSALKCLCDLLAEYETHRKAETFTATIMRYYSKQEIESNAELCAYVNKHIKFVGTDENKMHGQKGALVLDTNEAYSRDKNGDKTADVSAIVLPIPDTSNKPHGNNIAQAIKYYMPVAPHAFGSGYLYFDNVTPLTTREHYDELRLSKDVEDELISYFSKRYENGSLQSIISICIGQSDIGKVAEKNSRQYGVVNIHSETVNSMSMQMFDSYVHMSRPVIELIKDITLLHAENVERSELD